MALPTELTYLYTSYDEVCDLASSNGVQLRLDDDQSGTLTNAETERLSIQGVNKATAKCNLYLLERYTAIQLKESWQVHEWATTYAAVWLCRRRFNSVPKSLMDAWADALEEMQAVHDREMSLGDIAETESDQPTLSNMTLDGRYHLKQQRVQRPISSKRSTPLPQANHIPSDVYGGIEG